MHNVSVNPLRRVVSGSALALAGALAIAACSGTGAGTAAPTTAAGGATSAASAAAPSMAASTAPSVAAATPGATPLALMGFALLPQADVPKDVKVSCEDAAGATLSCKDAVALAARIGVTTSGAAPVKQVLVERGTDANAVTLTLWANDAETGELTAFTTTVDVAGQSITFPAENPDAVFPAS